MSRTLLLSTVLALVLLAVGLGAPAFDAESKEAGCLTSAVLPPGNDVDSAGSSNHARPTDGTGIVRTHEPAGFTQVACLRFDHPAGEGGEGWWPFGADRDFPAGWEVGDRRHLRIVDEGDGDEKAGVGAEGREGSGSRADAGSSVARARFPRGWRGGSSPVWAERDISHSESGRLYISFRLKISDDWQGHPVNDKLLYVWTHGRPVVFPVYVGGGDAPLSTEVRIQDVPGGARNLAPDVASVTIERGRWHQWEILLVASGAGRSDGQVHWWIDGRKVGEHTDVRFASPAEDRIWERVSWRPVWGGAGGVVRRDQYMWIDDLYASGAR